MLVRRELNARDGGQRVLGPVVVCCVTGEVQHLRGVRALDQVELQQTLRSEEDTRLWFQGLLFFVTPCIRTPAVGVLAAHDLRTQHTHRLAVVAEVQR